MTTRVEQMSARVAVGPTRLQHAYECILRAAEHIECAQHELRQFSTIDVPADILEPLGRLWEDIQSAIVSSVKLQEVMDPHMDREGRWDPIAPAEVRLRELYPDEEIVRAALENVPPYVDEDKYLRWLVEAPEEEVRTHLNAILGT